MKMYLDYERINHHKSMLSDRVRTNSFKKAIFETVKKGDVVADIGAGTGILAMFAAQAGAKRVYAVERTDIIEVAKKIAEANGLSNRIVFIKKDASKCNLPEKCDVIVSECIGYFALQENMVQEVIDFSAKHLKKGGKVIPSKIEMFVAPVESEEKYANVSFWNDLYGLDFSYMREIARNSTFQVLFDRPELLSRPKKMGAIDLKHGGKILFDKKANFLFNKNCVLHGFCGFFDAKLSARLKLSNSPLRNPTHWKNEFFPCRQPLRIKSGEEVNLSIKAIPMKSRVDWEWIIALRGIRLKHSTLEGIRLKEQKKIVI